MAYNAQQNAELSQMYLTTNKALKELWNKDWLCEAMWCVCTVAGDALECQAVRLHWCAWVSRRWFLYDKSEEIWQTRACRVGSTTQAAGVYSMFTQPVDTEAESAWTEWWILLHLGWRTFESSYYILYILFIFKLFFSFTPNVIDMFAVLVSFYWTQM